MPAKPTRQRLGLAVPMKGPAAAFASRLPAARGHVGVSAANRPGSDRQALTPPDRIVAVAGADQGVDDLVQERVPDHFFPVAFYERKRQLDGAAVVDAQAQRCPAAVVSERPARKAVGDH